MRRRPPRAGALAVTLLAALFCAPDGGAAIRARVEQGSVVFTSRPGQKPAGGGEAGVVPGAARPAPPREIDNLVKEVSQRYDMDPSLIATVIGVESGFNQMAVSPKGARGLMQLMPDTARQYGVRDVHDARENVEGGVAYLRDLVLRYNGDVRLALAAYNAGPEAVERASGVPNYQETRDYLRRIEKRYGQRLTVTGMGYGGLRAPGGGSIVAQRDATGAIVATNRRRSGVTLVPRGGKRRH